jgi:hypothetical protein
MPRAWSPQGVKVDHGMRPCPCADGLESSIKSKQGCSGCFTQDHSLIEGRIGDHDVLYTGKTTREVQNDVQWTANVKLHTETAGRYRWLRDTTVVSITKEPGRTEEWAASNHPQSEGTPMPVDIPHAVLKLHAISSLMATASAKNPWKPENLAIDPKASPRLAIFPAWFFPPEIPHPRYSVCQIKAAEQSWVRSNDGSTTSADRRR